MTDTKSLLFAKGPPEIYLLPKMANRHGLIAGATGTGKTVSLQVLAESFSLIGVPVFLSDVKGDLSGISKKGGQNPKIEERIQKLELEGFQYRAFPVTFWDIFGRQGHPIRTTLSEMGPLLLSRLLNLNETQSGVLNIVFKIADDMGLMLIDMKDLREMLKYVGDNAKEFTTEYGTISRQSIGTIQRGLLALGEQGAEMFFGEPALDIFDMIKTNENGMGCINILASDQLFHSPALYSTFLLWLLSELFEKLPEVGDMDKPKIIFFFDEAHLLFSDAPKVLLQKVEQVVRLIRSKGVGVYFITQNPTDIPQSVLSQLGNRVQHALRAFTPRDQNIVKTAAETFRANPNIDVAKTITELGVGEALISFLDEQGRPSVVEKAYVLPPRSYIGPISLEERNEVMRRSSISGRYENIYDRESAYEKLQERYKRMDEEEARQKNAFPDYPREKQYDYGRPYNNKSSNKSTQRKRTSDTPMEKLAKSAANSIGRELGRELVRGILGSLLKR